MPDITLCTNKTCPLRDNCKRGQEYTDKNPNQSWAHFSPIRKGTDYFNQEFWCVCDFQLKINE